MVCLAQMAAPRCCARGGACKNAQRTPSRAMRLLQEPVTGALDQVRGGAVDMARIMRLPFVRIRVALPEDIFSGDVAHACVPFAPQPLRFNA